MNLALKRKTDSGRELRQLELERQSLFEHLDLLEKSFHRCRHLISYEAQNTLIEAERELMCRRLAALCGELTK